MNDMEIEKAIGICKNLLKIEYDGCFGTKVYHPHSMLIEDIEAIETVLKELERLRQLVAGEINQFINDAKVDLYLNYVSKDKIRAKIEELEKDLQDFEQTDNTGRFIRTNSRDYDKKKALEELLEE